MIERTEEQHNLLIAAYQKVFKGCSTAQEGQLVFWDLIDRMHVFSPYNQQNAGAYAMEGRRELGLHIMEMVELSPNLGGINAVKVMEEMKQSMDAAAKLNRTALKIEE